MTLRIELEVSAPSAAVREALTRLALERGPERMPPEIRSMMLRGTEGAISEHRFCLWFSYVDRRMPPALFCRIAEMTSGTTRVWGSCRPTRYYASVQVALCALLGLSLLPNLAAVPFLAGTAVAVAWQLHLERKLTCETSVHARYLLDCLEEALAAAEVATNPRPVAV